DRHGTTDLMGLILNLAYLTFLVLALPVLLWRVIVLGKYRQGFAEKFFGRGTIPVLPGLNSAENASDKVRRVWLHGVSVGEINLLKPIVKELRESCPNWELVVSSTSKTGFELAQIIFPDLSVFYCPLDFTWSVRSAIKRIKPDWLVLVELELWPNLILQAKKQGVRVAIVNGRISDRSLQRYQRIRHFIQHILNCIDVIAAQDELAADSFKRLGARDVVVTGAIKFDGAQTDRNNEKTKRLAALAGLKQDDLVFIAGSTQEPEEQYALETWQKLVPNWPNLRLMIVPRHPERFESVAKMLATSGVSWCRRSQLTDEIGNNVAPVILIDTIGELGAWWGTAHIAFVGGSFGARGGQNMLEPGAYGAAVCFGPNTRNFRDISSRMLQEDAAKMVASPEELTAFVRHCLEDETWRRELGARAVRLVKSQRGATSRTVDLLKTDV
ncbi:MAG: 3-deoxy-D-manno-octulosonic acid transferase, partial [Planctomycetia bacterium]|nr:3-deoxy-D-manno-octulosonic acid transferase [Planctomycetia bacterium]